MSGKLRKLVLGGIVASLGAIVLDQRRRAALTEHVERAGRGVGARFYGTAKDFDDTTLTHTVESEIFRDAEVPKGQINVNAQKGVVQLRGEVPIFRLVYADPQYVRMAQRALPLWRELEAESGEQILTTHGSVDLGPGTDERVAALSECGVELDVVDGTDLAARYPLRIED